MLRSNSARCGYIMWMQSRTLIFDLIITEYPSQPIESLLVRPAMPYQRGSGGSVLRSNEDTARRLRIERDMWTELFNVNARWRSVPTTRLRLAHSQLYVE